QYKVSGSPNTVTPDAYGGGLIYIGGHASAVNGKRYNGSIRAFDPTVNKTVWQLGLPGEDYGAPVYANGLVVVTGGDDLFVLDAATGHVLFNYSANAPFLAAPSVAHGIIYIGNSNGMVLAFGLPNPASTYGVTFRGTGLPPVGCGARPSRA
ncbi:MAG: PQQ-binding-like beta-propeller repeat protein, partial [Thermoplasmata archaeon]